MSMQQNHTTPLACLVAGMCVISLAAAEPPSEPGSDLEALRQAARAEAAQGEQEQPGKETFVSRALGLQALNPELSVAGDVLWSYTDSEADDDGSDFTLRGLGLHLEAYLDPFTRFKAAVELNEDETELGEAYMTRFGLLPHVNLTLGKFRQQFGVVNRWHKHGLDQVDFPLALRQIFGPGGLNQTGGSLDWTLPELAGLQHELFMQVTDGENGRVFAENSDNCPSGLAHYKVFRDLTASTYAEIGVSGLYGRNDEWAVGEASVERSLDAWVFGADLTVLWEPTERMRYRNATWRTEAYALKKDIMAPDGSGEDSLNAWGIYSYLESKVTRTIVLGVRCDYFEPDVKDYAASEGAGLNPIAVTESGACRWQVCPYVTWHQSPFVHFRAEYDHAGGDGTGPEEDVFWLQCIFAAGPHKHERY